MLTLCMERLRGYYDDPRWVLPLSQSSQRELPATVPRGELCW